jgi:HEPN domain-containing protein
MTKANDSINNWIKSSNYDIKPGEHMLKAGRYIYVLFMCHLSVEKLLKALYEAVLAKVPPKTHNLIYLSNAVNLEIPEDHLKVLESLNDLSIPTRYPEDIDGLIKAFKRKRAEEYFKKTRGLLRWLKKDMRLKR